MRQFTRSMGLLALMAASVQAASVFPLPAFTVYGKVRDWNGRVLSSEDAATVVVKVGGVELARCDAKSGTYPSLTYRVQIPMASGQMAGRGQVGDPIAFEVYYDGRVHAVSAGQTVPVVGNPASAICCTLVVGTFTGGGGLPDEYKELLLPYYIAAGKGSSLADVLADDDFDGDGYSNLEEFLAGTIPVLADDYLRITAFSPLANGYQALSFLSAPGRTYTVPKSPALGSNAWNAAEFALTTNAPPAHTFYTSAQDAHTTLYLLPTTNRAAFLKLEVE